MSPRDMRAQLLEFPPCTSDPYSHHFEELIFWLNRYPSVCQIQGVVLSIWAAELVICFQKIANLEGRLHGCAGRAFRCTPLLTHVRISRYRRWPANRLDLFEISKPSMARPTSSPVLPVELIFKEDAVSRKTPPETTSGVSAPSTPTIPSLWQRLGESFPATRMLAGRLIEALGYDPRGSSRRIRKRTPGALPSAGGGMQAKTLPTVLAPAKCYLTALAPGSLDGLPVSCPCQAEKHRFCPDP